MDPFNTPPYLFWAGTILVSSAVSAGLTLLWYSLLLRKVSKWPDTVAQLIQAAPQIIEGLSRLGVGMNEIMATIHRLGGLKATVPQRKEQK